MSETKPEPKFVNHPVRTFVRVFHDGRMYGPTEKAGDVVRITGDELPSWAHELDKAAPAAKPKPNGDTKPADAQAAVQRKKAGFTDPDNS